MNVAQQQWIDLAYITLFATVISISVLLGYRAGRRRGREDVYSLWEQAARRRERETRAREVRQRG